MSEEASASPLHGKLCQKSDGFETEKSLELGPSPVKVSHL